MPWRWRQRCSAERQVRDGGLQGIEAVVERQQGVTAEGDDDRLLLCRERGGARLGGPGAPIGDISSRAPFGDGLGVHPVAPRQVPQALLTMLDRATDRLSRAGAAVENLTHSASLHAGEKTAPSNSGTKHLVREPAGQPKLMRQEPARKLVGHPR